MVIPVVMIGLVGLAYFQQAKKEPRMTAQRKVIYDTALTTLKDENKLAELAKSFEEAGLTAEASMLRKRAKLRSLPKDVKQKRREIFKQALTWTEPDKVEALAKAFEREAATGAAQELRNYAKALTAAKGVKEGEKK